MRECSIDVQRSVRASNQLGNQHKFSMFSYSPKQSSFFLYYLYIYFVASAPRSHPANERTEHSHVICNDAFSSGFSSVWKETKSQGKYYQFTNSSTDSVQSKFKRQTLSLDFRLEKKNPFDKSHSSCASLRLLEELPWRRRGSSTPLFSTPHSFTAYSSARICQLNAAGWPLMHLYGTIAFH